MGDLLFFSYLVLAVGASRSNAWGNTERDANRGVAAVLAAMQTTLIVAMLAILDLEAAAIPLLSPRYTLFI